jgi:hypothetical protein
MNIRAIVSILFCAVLLVACSACCSRESMVPNGMTAAELVAAALAAEEEIDNYQFNGVVIGAMTGGTTTVVDVSGIVDEQNRALHINMSHTVIMRACNSMLSITGSISTFMDLTCRRHGI